MVAALIVAALAGCGGDDGGGTQSKSAWQREHGDLFAAFEKDLDAAGDTINRGERQATISACTQLGDDAKEMREEVFPVPNPAVDGPLRASVDLAVRAADNCVQGGRTSAEHGARQVEAAMRELTDARQRLLEAKAAMDAWQ
jgi:hypothetical protein